MKMPRNSNAGVDIRAVVFALLVFFPFLRIPALVQNFSKIDLLINAALILFCTVALLSFVMTLGKRRKVSSFFIALIIFQISPLWSTVLYAPFDGFFLKSVAAIVSQIAFCWLAYVFIIKMLHSWLLAMNILMWACVLVNFLTILLFPDGMYHFGTGYTPATYRNWFLGYDNAHAQYFVYAIAISGFYEYQKRGRVVGAQTVLLYAICLVSTYIVHSATSLVSLVVMGLLLVFGTRCPNSSVVNIRSLAIAYVFIWMSVIPIVCNLIPMPDFVENFIVGPLDKESLFAARPEIWSSALELFTQYPLLGNGLENTDILLNKLGAGGTHNEVLGYLYEGGLIRLTAFLALFWLSMRNLYAQREKGVSKVISVALFAMFILQLMRGCEDILWLSLLLYGFLCARLGAKDEKPVYDKGIVTNVPSAQAPLGVLSGGQA